MSHIVVTDVRDGSLISQDETKIIECVVDRELDWEDVPGTQHEAGRFYQVVLLAQIAPEECEAVNKAIAEETLKHTWTEKLEYCHVYRERGDLNDSWTIGDTSDVSARYGSNAAKDETHYGRIRVSSEWDDKKNRDCVYVFCNDQLIASRTY